MGNSASTPQTKVFTPETPVEFSATFLLKLEHSPESDFSRAQHTEKYIQDRVAAELARLEKEAVALFRATAKSAIVDKPTSKSGVPEQSSHAIGEKIKKLTAMLKENAELSKTKLSDNVVNAREAVALCLKENQGKSLNCWDEVESFRKLVAEL